MKAEYVRQYRYISSQSSHRDILISGDCEDSCRFQRAACARRTCKSHRKIRRPTPLQPKGGNRHWYVPTEHTPSRASRSIPSQEGTAAHVQNAQRSRRMYHPSSWWRAKVSVQVSPSRKVTATCLQKAQRDLRTPYAICTIQLANPALLLLLMTSASLEAGKPDFAQHVQEM